jgi:ABC-2 type transport system ATP-binding protein
MTGRIGTARIEEVLDLVDLSGAASRRISAFSLGMRQRLGLASALLGDPQILAGPRSDQESRSARVPSVLA